MATNEYKMDQNSSAEWRQVMASWREVDIENLAKKFYESCQGDARKLLCSSNKESGIYGRLAQIVLKVNNSFARTSLHTFWVENKRNIKELYAKLKYPRAKNPPKLKGKMHIGTPTTGFCWCQSRIDGYSVMCDMCHSWYHILCCGITEEEAIGMGDFVCMVCKGSPEVPKIWIDSRRCQNLEIPIPEKESHAGLNSNKAYKETPRLSSSHAPRNLTATIFSEDLKEDEIFTPPLKRSIPAAFVPADITMPEGIDTFLSKEPSDASKTPKKGNVPADAEEEGPVDPDDLAANSNKRKPDDGSLKKKKIRMHNNIASDKKEYVEVPEIPTEFTISVTKEDWKKIVRRNTTKDGATFYEATSNYASVLAPYFNAINHICVIVGEKKILTHPIPEESSASFYIARTKCKAQECTAKFTFTVKRRPKTEAQQIAVHVKRSGAIRHVDGIRVTRFLKGEERAETKDALKLQRPGIYRREKFGLADKKQLCAWNYNMVKELQTYQQANFERKSEDDFHSDPIVDAVITSYHQKYHTSQKKLPGFIQSISITPFSMVMFCEEQLCFLHSLTQQRDVVLFLDATGTLSQRLPKPYPQTSVYYYALVAKPAAQEPPVPVVEFYSASHDASSIEACLRTFFSSYKKYCNIRGKSFGIVRVEIDFSKALIAAVSSVFQRGDVEEYINYLWASLVDPNRDFYSYYAEPTIAIHVCRIHVNRFWGRKVDRTFGKKQSAESVRTFYKDWMVKFIRTKTIQSIQRRMYDVLLISGSVYMNDENRQRLEDIDRPTNYDGYEQLVDFERPERNTEEPFYRRSMFGKMALKIQDLVKRLNEECMRAIQLGAQLEKNAFYSNAMFDYLLIHVLPYAPILNHTVFSVFKQPVGDDTTNNVENWIGILKRDYFRGDKNMKIGRLARAHEKLISGSIVQALAAIHGLGDHLPEKHIDEEDDVYEGIDPLIFDKNAEVNKVPEEHNILPTAVDKSAEHVGQSKNKTSLSPEQASEVWGHKKRVLKRKAPHAVTGMPVIPVGAKFKKDGRTYRISNTCNIDTTLQVLYFLHTYTNCHSFFESVVQDDQFSRSFRNVIHMIGNQDLDGARGEWIQSVLGLQLDSDVDIFGSENDNGTSKLRFWLKCIKRNQMCLNASCQKTKSITISLTEIVGLNALDILNKLHNGELKENWCNQCKSSCRITFSCDRLPDLFVYTCDGLITEGGKTSNRSKEIDLPMTQNIFGSTYEVLAYTCYTGNHFYSVVVVDGYRFTVDGLRGAVEPRRVFTDEHAVSSVWLYRKQ